MLQLRHLRYFVKIVEAGSFSRAAAAIHVAQPALSQQIAELEQLLGVALLHRNARGVSATPAGEVLFAEASAILRQMERIPDIVRSSGGEAQGVVKIGMSSTLASFLAGAFMEASRQLLPKVSLRFTTGDSMSLKARLSDQTLDLAVVFEDEQTGGFVRRPLFRQRLFLVRRKRTARTPPSITLASTGRTAIDSAESSEFSAHPARSDLLGSRHRSDHRRGNRCVFRSAFRGAEGMGEAILPKGDFSDVPGYTAAYSRSPSNRRYF